MDIFVSLGLSQVDIIVSLKMACSWSTTTFYIISSFFHQKLRKLNFLIFQNDGLTSIDWDSGLLAIVQKDIFLCRTTFNV